MSKPPRRKFIDIQASALDVIGKPRPELINHSIKFGVQYYIVDCVIDLGNGQWRIMLLEPEQ